MTQESVNTTESRKKENIHARPMRSQSKFPVDIYRHKTCGTKIQKVSVQCEPDSLHFTQGKWPLRK